MLYLFLAEGFEIAEAIVPLDLVRRAGIRVLTVAVGKKTVISSNGVPVTADISLNEVDLTVLSGIILPGGMPGTENLYNSEKVRQIVRFCDQNHLLIACICAAPSVPGRMDILCGKKAVCFPGFENKLHGAVLSDRFVETDGNFITAKGAGCVFPFSHAIISYCDSKQKADEVLAQIQYTDM